MQDRKEKHLYAERVRESLMLASCQVRGAALHEREWTGDTSE